ncbi:TonB-dependent receptor [Stenotrophomonas panacihumi]|uniref:TonB-dependent receptor n=1 Tax=Stenotrophomonas panacihumi TaxID=676599 RepID=A0A0R0A7A2_9GAMM|nr:TonB-dependent receptor [Stenotrophomonas panacihumi]KRG40966.1 TonB-dependent receptor [Stenotrophomonas panacihumi]PTN53873.1 TonB-dependent receptor [Stenotrophomonas panacihumi]
MKYRKSVLTSAIVTCLAFSAHAQDAGQQQTATDLDTVQVIGIRGSMEKSLDTKREAQARVEVVTAEDIGKLPAKNVADTLRELPGVNISSSSASEGAFDEADRVSLRGTNPSLTQTLVNGHTIGTGDWFVLSQVANVGRSVSYSLLPSEIVDQVVVNKSSQAKLVEGGSAGSVNIITRKPLQFADNLTTEASVGAAYSDLPDKTEPQVSALLNWKNDANTVGVMVQGFYEKRSLRRDGQEVVGGYGVIPDDAAVVATNPDLAGVLYPNLLGAVYFDQTRERKGGVLDVQIKATDSLTLNLNGFYSKLEADNYNRNYMMWASQFVNTQAPNPGYVIKNGVLTQATYAPTTSATVTPYGVYDMISRPNASSESKYLTLDADWQASDNLNFKFQAGTTDGSGKSPTQDVLETGTAGNAGASWSMGGLGDPIDWSLGGVNTPANHLPQNGWIFGGQAIDVKDSEDWFAADGELFANADSVLNSFDFGVRYSEHERKNDFEIAQGPNFASNWTDISAYPTTGGSYPGDFGSDLGGSVPGGIWYYTPSQLAQINADFANRDPVSRFYFSDVYGVKEKISAAYVQANFAGTSWSGNIGLRYVKTDTDVSYNQSLPVNSGIPGAISGSAFGDYLPTTVQNDYSRLLPSANLKFDLSDDLVARFAVSQTMTRPDYSALAGSLSLDDLTHTGSGGNPQLKPIVSTNYDANLEWYFAPRALLSFGVFAMQLNDYINFGTTTISYKDQAASYASGTDVYADYQVSVPVNTNGNIKGFEVAYQQPIGEFFGVSANYTYADGEASGGGPLNGTSKNTYNLAGFFENDRFSARVSWNWRDDFYAGVSRTDEFYQKSVGALSASLSYHVTDWMTVSLDGLNLNNPVYKYYTNSDAGFLPYAFYANGRQYYLNLRFKF